MSVQRTQRRTSLRVRLAATYTTLFMLTGAMLLTVSYKLVEARTGTQNYALRYDPTARPRSVENAQQTRIRKLIEANTQTSQELVAELVKLSSSNEPRPSDATQLLWKQRLDKALSGPSKATQEELNSLLEGQLASLRRRTLNELVRQSLIALAAMSAVSVALGWILAGRALQPVHQITATARRLSDANLGERINLGGANDELRELGDTFDSMLDRIQVAFDNERRLIANTSHELRTPLAVQRTLLDVTLADDTADAAELRSMAEKVRTQVIRHEELIEKLLFIARTNNAPIDASPLDLAGLVAKVRADTDLSAVAKVNERLSPAPINGDLVLMSRLVANLIDNARSHNVERGYIDLSTSTSETTVQLVVANSGPPLTRAQLEMIRLPFRRVERDRTQTTRGLGLGLAIVESIAHAHGGIVGLEAISSGGLRVTVTLPRR
jgi:signal transduction histidine kinase